MDRAAERIKLSDAGGEPAAAPAAPASRRPAGTDADALAELRNAAVTYDFLRRRADPAEFWEALRLARSRRAIVAPSDGAPVAAPAPEIEASIVGELDLLRRHHGQLVRDLRRFLKQVQGLPEPAERLEMALAFLLASTREHQAVARWVAEPGKHGVKAAERLRSLAAITDPYREALRPWVLTIGGGGEAPARPATTASPPESKPTTRRQNLAAVDPETLAGVRLAIRCREVLSGVYLDSDLWETLLLVTNQPEPTRTALDRIEQDAEAERLEELEAKAEVLFKKVATLRLEHGYWVQPFKEALLKEKATPQDPHLFEIALALTVVAPGVAAWVGLWSADPQGYADEATELWTRSIARATVCRTALESAGR